MIWQILLTAVALVLVFEGLLPFLNPAGWRRIMMVMVNQSDKNIRMMGLVSLIIGAVIMVLVHSGLFW